MKVFSLEEMAPWNGEKHSFLLCEQIMQHYFTSSWSYQLMKKMPILQYIVVLFSQNSKNNNQAWVCS
jgi:hypothetical protein